MKLLSLKAHNVFSIGDIELDLRDRGLVLVTGWSEDENNGNMAGKSSVANHCISWGLYGRTVHGVKADAVINTSIPHAKHCGVTLNFEGIDGKKYRIYRARKPNSLVLSVLMERCPDEEWMDLSKRNEKDTQELINSLLGRDHKTFIQSDFFGQGRERSFLALPGSDQKAVIEEILPLNSLEEWKEKAKEELKDVETRVSEATSEFALSRERLSQRNFHLDSLSTQRLAWDKGIAGDIQAAQGELNEILALDSVIEDEIAALRESVPPGELAEVLDEQTTLDRSLTRSLGTLSHRIDTLTSDIDRRAARPDVCTACEQELPEERIELNIQAWKDDRHKRDDLVKERGEKEAKQYLAASMIAICREIQSLEKKVERQGQRAAVEEKLRLLRGGENPFIDTVTFAAEEVRREEVTGETFRLMLVGLREELNHYKFWVNAYGTDLKTILFNQVCPFLERKANQYLNDLDNGQIKVKFRTVKLLKSGDARDQFCVTAASDTGSTVFELFSGAEKQLTSFAVGMALSDLAGMQTEGASSLMILDEPFLYQSPENCERIVTFITQKMGDDKTILLISNEDNLVNLVHDRVHVVKKKGVTSIDN
jgi:DNA repair exonuclease SbcCD ATPase subunit